MALKKGEGSYRPTMHGTSKRITRPAAPRTVYRGQSDAPPAQSGYDCRHSDESSSSSTIGAVGIAVGLAILGGILG
jgi:hypothetical protein